jgi:hypothetical protein
MPPTSASTTAVAPRRCGWSARLAARVPGCAGPRGGHVEAGASPGHDPAGDAPGGRAGDHPDPSRGRPHRGRNALVPPAVMLTIAPPWSREMANIRKPPWDGVTEGPYGACAGPHRLGCAGGVCVCMKTPGACHMNSEWILCIRRHAYRPLVMLRAYEAPTLQSLTGYTSLVEAMNARCA